MTGHDHALEASVSRMWAAWQPPARMSLSAWAEEHFYLSPESSAEAGRWRTLPYQRGIMDALTDPDVERVSVMKSSRIGWTKCGNALIAYHMHQDPCPVMVVQPTIEDARGYSQEEIAPMLRDCPVLTPLAAPARTRDSGNTILAKRFRGGSLTLVGANSPRGFRRVSRRVLFLDEVDGYPLSAGQEGDPITLAIRRTEYYWDRKIATGSTPTVAGVSRIEQLFQGGDQRRYYVPCPHCGEHQVLVFPQFRWPKGRPELAVYICRVCGSEIEHTHKRAMVEAGEWRAGPHAQFPNDPAPGPFTGHASFHIWAAYSYSPNATWGQLAAEFAEAQRGGPETLKTFVNTVLGEPWREKGEAPEWERLYARRDRYALGTCPPGVLFLTAGVDVQKDRLVYEVVGWGREKRSWSVDVGVLPGDTADLTAKGPWGQLEALLNRTYPHASGVELGIQMLAVDSGAFTQTVYAWARTKPMNRVMAVKGFQAQRVLVAAPSSVEITVRGRKLKRGYKVWPVGTDVAKTELYGWLSLQAPTDEERQAGAVDPPGYCRFPEHGEDYFKQLTAEQLVKTRTRKGYVVMTWEPIPGRENHQLDCRNYARAAAAIVGIDRFTPSDWQQLEVPLVRAAESESPPSSSESLAPLSSSPMPPSGTPRPRGWLPQRPDWLRGRR